MIPIFTIAAVCCIPVHNPAQREREHEILGNPACKRKTTRWKTGLSDEARADIASADERLRESLRAFPVVQAFT